MNNSITLETEENITIMKALEYLAYKWEPYADDDIIMNPKVLDIRKDEYFLTDNKMKKAVAQLEIFIRNRKIKLSRSNLTSVTSNLRNAMSLVIFPDNYKQRKVELNNDNDNAVDNGKIKSVQLKFMKINRNASLPSYLNGESITHMTATESNCYYIPVCIVDYGFSTFIYPDHQGIIKFSELEQCNEVEFEKRGRPKKISDIKFAIFFLELISKGQILTKNDVNKERKEIYGKVLDTSKEKFKDPTLNYKYISEKTKPYLDVFEGKYIEIYNR